MQRHVENPSRIAEALAAHARVSHVYYPGLAGHPGHHVARKQMSGFGGMVSFELAGSIRLSPGIEHAADLIEDLRAGLHHVAIADTKSIVICT